MPSFDEFTFPRNFLLAKPGEHIERVLQQALALLAAPGAAYAYVAFNGVIVTLDHSSTLESAAADYSHRLGVLCDATMTRAHATEPA